MPQFLNLDGVLYTDEWTARPALVPVATEQELLDFCNAVRGIGGAEVISALLPGQPRNAAACLIARNLNFDCTVGPSGRIDSETGFEHWTMTFPDAEIAARVATTLGLDIADNDRDGREMVLPAHIGHAAKAFDQDAAFTEHIQTIDF